MRKADIERWAARLLPVLVVLAAAAAFLPALRGGWVGWDDPEHFLNNPFYRGLGAAQLRWMFEGPHLGQYFPLAWATLGFDYCVWGMEACGYHLTNVLLHAASAGVLYAVSLRLFRAGAPSAADHERRLAAAAAALAWAVHPLRVESVAWIAERRDVLSGVFYLLTILLYLRSCSATNRNSSSKFRAAALAAYAASLLSKAIGVTLPAALLILDVYPLKRLTPDPRRWSGARERAVLIEKIPFALLAAAALIAGWAGLRGMGMMSGLGDYGLSPRIAQASYGSLFYLWKTVWPFGLTPLYEAPALIRLSEPRFAACLAAVAALAAALWAVRRRLPAAAAAGAFYAVTLAPVSGLVRNGLPYLAVDRYCYLPSLGVSLLIGTAALAGLRRDRRAALLSGAALLAFWGALAWRQTGYWRDSMALWGHTLDVEHDHAVGNENMAAALAERGDFVEAAAHAKRAAELRPDDFVAVDDYGVALLRLGRPAEAAAEFERAAALDPAFAPALHHWGVALADQRRFADAADRYRRSLALDDSQTDCRFALGNALAALGRDGEAIAAYERTLRDDPELAPARLNYGLSLAGAGRADEAAAQFRLALRSRTEAPAANYDWGNLLAERGDLEGAIRRYREAARLAPGMLDARFNLGNTLARAGRYADAQAQYRAVLALAPSYPGAAANLSQARRLAGRAAISGRR